jgi:hypothetical protein
MPIDGGIVTRPSVKASLAPLCVSTGITIAGWERHAHRALAASLPADSAVPASCQPRRESLASRPMGGTTPAFNTVQLTILEVQH